MLTGANDQRKHGLEYLDIAAGRQCSPPCRKQCFIVPDWRIAGIVPQTGKRGLLEGLARPIAELLSGKIKIKVDRAFS